jgi:endonuclease/exonuclease/phosphatase family metal-dependent hydrolase
MLYSLRSRSGLGNSLVFLGLLCGCSSAPHVANFAAPSTVAPVKPVAAVAAPVVRPAPLAAGALPQATASHVIKLSSASATSPKAVAASPAAATASAPRPLNVMTVNLEHHDEPSELQTVAALLKANKARTPDFIFCQEVLFNRGGAEDSTAAVFAKEMGYHVRGTKRTSDREGIAILSKYPIDYYDAINLKSQTSRLLLGFRRVSTMAETTVPGVGKVRLVNVHFTNWGFETRVRREQLKETLEWAAARERKAPAALTFLAGDFNAEPDFAEMALIKDRSVTGPLAFRDSNGSEFSQGSKGSPSKRIDFIFVSGANLPAFSGEELMWRAGVPTADGGSFYLSDHLAVLHRYVMAPAAAPAPTKAPKPILTATPMTPAVE